MNPASSVHGIAPSDAWTAPPLPEALARRYRVRRKIGQGGMGAVYVADDLTLDRQVVLKQLLMREPDQVARLEREAQVLGRLSHPRILKLYGVEVFDGEPVLVLELVEGVTLRATLEATPRLDTDRALGLADAIADALGAVHAAGLIHRDLKPDNVLLTADGGCKVLDFGLARQVERADDDAPLTEPGVTLGTPHFMAPELWRCEPLDARADLYALGVILFEMLAGQLPFDAETPAAVAVKHLTEEAPPLLPLAPRAGAGVAALVHCLLAKEPAARPASAADLRSRIAALRAALADSSGARDVRSAPEAPSSAAAISRKAAPREGLTRVESRPEPHPAPRRTGLTAAVAPSGTRGLSTRHRRRSLAYILAVIGVLCLFAAAALSRLGPSAPVTTPIPKDITVRLASPRTVTLTFNTATPSRWTLTTSARASVTETAEARVHAFTLAVPPWAAPDAMELTCGARTVQVEPPAGARALVRRLAVAVRAAKLDLTATDRVYEAIRPAFRDWNVMDPLTATAARAARELAERPELAGPLMELSTRALPAVEALAPVRALVPEALTDATTPPELQEELLDSLARLDHVDALAGYYGQPPPAGVQALLRRVLDVHVRTLPARASPGSLPPPVTRPPGTCRAFAPPANLEGIAVFLPDEDVSSAGAGIAPMFALHSVPGLVNVEPGSSLRLPPCVPPGPLGHRLTLTVRSFPTGTYLWLACGRVAAGLPLRIEPAEDAGVKADLELTVRIPTALAPPGHAWTLSQRRLFRTASRIYFVVRAADLAAE